MSSLSLQSPLTAIPLFTALSFLIVGSPVVYKFTDKYIAKPLKLNFVAENGEPTRPGIVVHAIVIAILMYVFLRAYSPEASMY
jgi:hypothetical protein